MSVLTVENELPGPCEVEYNSDSDPNGVFLEEDRGYSIKEAAHRLGVSRHTADNWAANGTLRVVRAGHSGRGRGKRVSAKDVERLRERQIRQQQRKLESLLQPL